MDTTKRFIADHGELVLGKIPRPVAAAKKYFDAAANEIVLEWLRRRSCAPVANLTVGESAVSWFKRNVYCLIKTYVEQNRVDVLAHMARVSGRSLVGLEKIEANPFKVALFGMWSDNGSLTRHQQGVFGTQMQYAYEHDVEPRHLLGFIAVAGSPQRIAQKLKSGEREPGFI